MIILEYHITTPIPKNLIYKLKIGDIVYLNGMIYTGRDEAHIEIIKNKDENSKIIEKLKNGVIYHAGPIMRKTSNGWICIAIGPTTSARMNNLEGDFIKITNISGIVGKGGMDKKLLPYFKEYGTVYLSAPGGCAALLSNCVKSVNGVYLEDLGMPESIWELEVENFGPLIVSMDTNGNSIYENVNNKVMNNLKNMLNG